MSQEIWKDVPGYEGFYQISDFGRIRRVKAGIGAKYGLILKPGIDTRATHNPYARIMLYNGSAKTRKRFQVHRLVAAAFIGPCPDGFDVNHKDGDPTNNKASNLEYLSRIDHDKHTRNVLKRSNKNIGEAQGRSKLTSDKVREIRRLYATGKYFYKDIAKMYGVGYQCIGDIIRGRNWKHLL